MDYSWMIWLLIPAFLMCAAGVPTGTTAEGAIIVHPPRSEEISRLKAELAASQSQIDALKTRLEAVETIVTDEEAELRWEFHKLQES